MSEAREGLRTVHVKFAETKYNYHTDVSNNPSDESLRDHFVGATFNLGAFPIDDMQTCIGLDITGQRAS